MIRTAGRTSGVVNIEGVAHVALPREGATGYPLAGVPFIVAGVPTKVGCVERGGTRPADGI